VAFENGAAAGAAVGTAAIPIPGVGTVVGGIIGGLLGGGIDKNAVRAQRENALVTRVLAGGADGQAAAQTLYENATGANGDNNPAATRTDAKAGLTQLASLGIQIGNHTITGGKYGQSGGGQSNGTNAAPSSILANIFGQNQNGTGAPGGSGATESGLGPIGGLAAIGLVAAGLIYAVVSAAKHKGK